MSSITEQFSPPQILAFGQKAEAEDKLEYAHKFYSFIVDHLGNEAEADAAREGLKRVAERQRKDGQTDFLARALDGSGAQSDVRNDGGGFIPKATPPAKTPQNPISVRGYSSLMGRLAQPFARARVLVDQYDDVDRDKDGSQAANTPKVPKTDWVPEAPPAPIVDDSVSAVEKRDGDGEVQAAATGSAVAYVGSGAAIEGTAGAQTVGVAMPNPASGQSRTPIVFAKRYYTGRLIARLLSGLGWVLLLSGAGIGAMVFFNFRPLDLVVEEFAGLTSERTIAFVCYAGGLVLVVIGQVMRAVFEGANAALEALAVERSRSGW